MVRHLGPRPAENLQGGEATDDVEKVAREQLQGPELTVGPGLGLHPDQGHEDRDERQCHDHDGGGHPVHSDTAMRTVRRDDHRQDDLRQIAAVSTRQGRRSPGPPRWPGRPTRLAPLCPAARRATRSTSAARSIDFTRAEHRLAAISEHHATTARSGMTTQQELHRAPQLGQVLPVHESAGDDRGQ